MKSILCFVIAAAAFAAVTVPATPAAAQRVFVAAQGSDANPCSFALPCRTFQHAHDTVAAGGEIDVLDPAGYGAVSITKAISIQGHAFAGISVASGGTGVAINAGPTDAINLNGLLIEGTGAGTHGIHVNSAKSLVVDNCVVRNMQSNGFVFDSGAGTLQTVSIAHSYFADNGSNGIFVAPSGSGAVTVSLDRLVISGNTLGLQVAGAGGTGPLSVAMADSVVANNSGTGIAVSSNAGHAPSSLVLTRVTSVGNGIGVATSSTAATMRLAQSAVTGNATGYFVSNSSLLSYGDNTIDNNGSNTGSLGSATPQ
jgi:hypothetical protein